MESRQSSGRHDFDFHRSFGHVPLGAAAINAVLDELDAFRGPTRVVIEMD